MRDEIAIAAMQALIAKSPFYDKYAQNGKGITDMDQFRLDIAASAYEYADAMIKQREVPIG